MLQTFTKYVSKKYKIKSVLIPWPEEDEDIDFIYEPANYITLQTTQRKQKNSIMHRINPEFIGLEDLLKQSKLTDALICVDEEHEFDAKNMYYHCDHYHRLTPYYIYDLPIIDYYDEIYLWWDKVSWRELPENDPWVFIEK